MKRMITLERERYRAIYASNAWWWRRYGNSNNGRYVLPVIARWVPHTLLDVGCGRGDFAVQASEYIEKVYGQDFALPEGTNRRPGVTWISGPADLLPLVDIDVVTAFDLMEHLLPEQVDGVIEELLRVARHFVCLMICCRQTIWRCKGSFLHPTVRRASWWQGRLEEQAPVGVMRHQLHWWQAPGTACFFVPKTREVRYWLDGVLSSRSRGDRKEHKW